MLVDRRRGLRLGAALVSGGAGIFLLVALPSTRPAVQAVDQAAWAAAGALRNRPTTAVAVTLSWLGGTWVTWTLRALTGVQLVRRRRWALLAEFALAVVTSELLIGPVKAVYDRPRPPGALIRTSAASFPSGHAIAAGVTAMGPVLVLARPGQDRWRWEVRATTFAGVMALSRVYLRAHWLSDAVAGALMGTGIAVSWPALLSNLRDRRSGRNT